MNRDAYESWFVNVIHVRENSIGRKTRECMTVSFDSFRDAFEYWVDRNYLLRCTDLVEKRREQWTVEEPSRLPSIIKGCRKRSYVPDWVIEW